MYGLAELHMQLT